MHIKVTQVVEIMSDSDDRDDLPAGSGEIGSVKLYEVPSSIQRMALEQAKEVCLDWFHNAIPIGCLEDFDIDVDLEGQVPNG